MQKIFTWFITWRLLLFIPVFLGILLLPFRENSQFTTLWQYTEKHPIIENELLSTWANFDGVHYIAIASRWYKDEGRFLPLFPVTVGVVAAPLSLIWPIVPYGPATFWAGLFVSSLAFLLAMSFLRKLLLFDFNEKIVQKTLFFLLIFPTAFFFGAIYSEGLFLLLSVLALYFARKKQWFFACLAGMFLSITRLSGVLIIFPLLVEYYISEIKSKNEVSAFFTKTKLFLLQLFGKKQSFLLKKHIKLLYFLLIPLLLVLYSYFNYIKWGDFLYFVHAHGALGNSRETGIIVFPLITVYRYIKILLTVSPSIYEFWVALLEFGSLLFAVWGIFIAWKQKVRFSYQVYAWVMIALPLLSGTLSGFPRYILPIFPFFLAQALWFEKQEKTKLVIFFFWVVCTLFILLQGLLLALFARGYYVS